MLSQHFRGSLMAPSSTAGGGGGGTGDGPPTMESILAEVDKKINSGIAAGLEKFKKESLAPAIQEHLAPISTSLTGITEALGKLTPPAPTTGDKGGVNPELNVQLKELNETTKKQGLMIESLKKEKQEADERAERSERHGIIRQALGNMHFISDVAAQTAFKIVEPSVKRLEDGQLVGTLNGDDFPIDAFVKDFLTKEHPYLLRASGTTGSGAPLTTGLRMGVKADLNDIKSGMKPETRESIVSSIQAALVP